MVININEINHSATNGFGTKLMGYFKSSSEDPDVYNLYESPTGKKLGYIDFNVLQSKKVLFINDMENLARNQNYKGVGSLLHEFIYYYMAKNNINYAIQLTVAHHSHVFHYKCGFRFQRASDNELIEALIAKGSNFTKKENLKDLPDSMHMPVEKLNLKKEKYKTAQAQKTSTEFHKKM